jgi:polysaccharide biosynthesis transport protein
MVRSKVDDSDGDEMDIDLDITGILRRRYPHITLGVLIGATIATIYFFQQVPIYESVLTVLVGQRSSELASIGTPRYSNSDSSVQDILATHMELITSRKIIERAISQGNLLLSPKEILGGFQISKGGTGTAKNASVLKASFQAKDPELAAKVLQSIFDSYFDYIQEKSRNVGEEAAKLISDSLVQCEQELKEADAAYRDYISAFPAIVGSEGDRLENIHALRLQKIETELSEVRKSLSQFRSRHEVIKEFARGKKAEELTDLEVMTLLDQNEVARLMTVVNMNNSVSMQRFGSAANAMTDATTRVAINYEQRLLDLNSRKDQLESTLGSSHPMYRAVLQELANVQEYMERARRSASNAASAGEEKTIKITASEMLVSYVNLLTGDIREFETREKELLVLSKEESKLAKEIETSFLQSGSYRSRLDRAQKRYDQVFSRLQEINLTNSASGFSTDLIVPPAPNLLPVWPSKTKIAALGILAGGMLGLALAFLAEMTDRTFRDPGDVEKLTNASILAHVPKLDQAKIKKNQKANYIISPMVATFHAPGGSAAETFRVLRTAILFLGKTENKRVIMVTSPSPGDGKSTTVSNLAVSLAQAGRKVLLVDGDLRRPTIAKMFGITTGKGLTDYLKETADFQSCCHPCEQPNLTICPDGAVTSHPAELLQSDRFPEFLNEARAHFDIILVDAPPLLAVADPAIIGSVVDGCFLTIRIERNNRTLVERACEVLADNNTSLDGIIINSMTSHSSGYGYSSYNYYSKKGYGYVDTYRRQYAVRAEAPVPTNGFLTGPTAEPETPKNGQLDPFETEVSKS